MRLLGYTLIQYDWCLYEKNRRNTGAALGEPHTVMNTESGGVELSAKDGKRFSATTEGGETQQGSAQRDDMGCTELSSSCSNEIDDPLYLRRISQGISRVS